MRIRIVRLACFLLLLLPAALQATHIVGGEINYTCLGNNNYEIELVVYRDWVNGNPGAQFDDPAAIGIFNSDNILLQNILVPFDPMIDDTLESNLSADCFVSFEPVGVHTTTYRTVVNLPPIPGGYQIAYQRCCRNGTIVNLINPLDVGATFLAVITEKALLECNSNPKFKEWPPLFICLDEPLVFDHSATDIDGDSIAYKLCTPLNGADPVNPMPQPPNPPPYQLVPWAPGYDETRMLGASQFPLKIDVHTGQLTALPKIQGQFVVGVCAEEYRNGELISVTRRDFQYNVGICEKTTSAFFAPELQCESLTVSFDNQSLNADDFLWLFEDPTNPGASSTLAEPSYTFPDTGTYTITLIAEPGTECADTSSRTVRLELNSLFPDFAVETTECSDTVRLEFTDLTVDTASNPVAWHWVFDFGAGQVSTSDQRDPPALALTAPGVLLVQLTVTAANGCEKTIERPVEVFMLQDELLADSVLLCLGDSIHLNPTFPLNATYSWAPGEGLSDPTHPNPLAFPTQSTTYSVTIEGLGNLEGCRIERSIAVTVPPPLLVEAPNDTAFCSPDFLLAAQSNFGVQYTWALDPAFSDVIAQAPQVLVTPFGVQTYYLRVRDGYGCEAFDTVTLEGRGVNVELDSLHLLCLGDTVQLSAQNLDPQDTLSFNWLPPELIVAGGQTPNPTVAPVMPGLQYVFVELENQNGCTLLDSVALGVLDTVSIAGSVSWQQCGGFSIHFSNDSPNAPFYVWHFGDPSNPSASSTHPNPVYTYPAPGTYSVTLSTLPGVECPDTLNFEVEVGDPQIEVAFDFAFGACSDSLEIFFTDQSSNQQSTITNWQWWFSNGTTATGPTASVVVTESQDLLALLEITSADGCVDSLQQSIPIELIEAELPDTVVACPGLGVELNPDGRTDYSYLWSPPEGLSDPTAPNPLATPTATTTYSVIITNVSFDTCRVERSVTAFVPPAIELNHTPDTVVCGVPAELQAQSPQATSFEWSELPSFEPLLGTGPSLTVEGARPRLVYLRAFDAYGCSVVDSIQVSDLGVELLLEDDTLCVGDTLRLTAMDPHGDALSLHWEPAGLIVEGQGTLTPLVNPTTTTVFSLAADNGTCRDTFSTTVFVLQRVPELEVSPVLDTILEGESIQLNATLAQGYTYSWSPANTLSDPSIPNPLASPTETTSYTVTVRDEDGCLNARTVTIVVFSPECAEPFLFIPSGFSPNGDGKNDVWRVFGNNIDELHLMVFDRWGEKVFETRSPTEGWDGTYKGRALPPDVFGYWLEIRCRGGQFFVKKGNVTLLR